MKRRKYYLQAIEAILYEEKTYSVTANATK